MLEGREGPRHRRQQGGGEVTRLWPLDSDGGGSSGVERLVLESDDDDGAVFAPHGAALPGEDDGASFGLPPRAGHSSSGGGQGGGVDAAPPLPRGGDGGGVQLGEEGIDGDLLQLLRSGMDAAQRAAEERGAGGDEEEGWDGEGHWEEGASGGMVMMGGGGGGGGGRRAVQALVDVLLVSVAAAHALSTQRSQGLSPWHLTCGCCWGGLFTVHALLCRRAAAARRRTVWRRCSG